MAEDVNTQTSWLQRAKANPFKAGAAVLTFISTVVGMVMAVEAHFATKDDLMELKQEVVNVAVMKYEDDLMAIEFRIESGEADEFDRVVKSQIERRLEALRNE